MREFSVCRRILSRNLPPQIHFKIQKLGPKTVAKFLAQNLNIFQKFSRDLAKFLEKIPKQRVVFLTALFVSSRATKRAKQSCNWSPGTPSIRALEDSSDSDFGPKSISRFWRNLRVVELKGFPGSNCDEILPEGTSPIGEQGRERVQCFS